MTGIIKLKPCTEKSKRSICCPVQTLVGMVPFAQLKNVEAKLSKFILMMPKTQVKNQESNKFQESKSRSIKIQDSSKESREDSIKISMKRAFQNIE